MAQPNEASEMMPIAVPAAIRAALPEPARRPRRNSTNTSSMSHGQTK
jgi:hypothetical protein